MTCKAACLLVMGMLVSCIKNDIPYPYIEGVIQAIEVKGIVGDAKIDKQRHAVEVVVDEDADLKAIVVTKLVANSEAKIPDWTIASHRSTIFQPMPTPPWTAQLLSPSCCAPTRITCGR